jgi:hypothetical protein
MPKNRKRVQQKGAKSESIRTKHKIGGRKSGRGTNAMSWGDLQEALKKPRNRDLNKLLKAARS